jgi:ubiquinone/menaquinone biosynthesis C-methylase UbiE
MIIAETNLVNNPNKALWEKGDFTRIATSMRRSGEALVKQLRIQSGMKVLDLGCGDGTTAIPAARFGANVLGVDIAANLVAAGNRRARYESLGNITFQEGDASDLKDLRNNSFDLVISIFGAMFAPRPQDVAKEMVRVTRPGGKIVMGNWIPGDPTLVAQILKISSAYTPPPPEGFVSPMLWGVEKHIEERFANAGISTKNINCQRDNYKFEFEGSPVDLVQTFRLFYGPTMNAFETAEKDGKARRLQMELEELFVDQNQSKDPRRTIIPATFMRVTITISQSTRLGPVLM